MNIYNIQASKSFLQSLITGIIAKFGSDPIDICKIKILLPTKRACRMFDETYLEMMDYKPCVIPKTYPIGDLGEDEIIIENFLQEAPEFYLKVRSPISDFEQHIILAKLIQKHHKTKKLNLLDSMDLATSLISFYADFKRDEIEFSELNKLEMFDISEGWQEMLEFLKIVTEEYPKYLLSIKKSDPVTYRNYLINMMSEIWQKNPPSHPVIIAGSTGSIAVTRKLIKTIYSMKNGYVILPSVDLSLDEETWNILDLTHPGYMLKQLLDYVGIDRNDVIEWDGSTINEENAKFMHAVFTPSFLTYKWHLLEKNLKPHNFKLIECEKLSSEAQVISLIIRDFIEEDASKKAIIVTNNQDLAKIIRTYVKRWDLNIENSAGDKISETKIGKIFTLAAEMLNSNFEASETLALLKHVLDSDDDKLSLFEKIVFRDLKLKNGLNSIYKKLEQDPEILLWFKDFIARGSEFISYRNKTSNFNEILIAHIKFIENIYGGREKLYQGKIGEKFHACLTMLLGVSEQINKVSFSEYSRIFQNFMNSQTIRIPDNTYPNIKILSPIEARHIDADLVIIAGVNETVWPRSIPTNPWMSKAMRKELGLSPEEHIISLSAHDFYKLCHMKNVIITYSNYIDGSPSTPSRWIQRIRALAEYLSIENDLKPDKPFLEWARAIDFSGKYEPISAPSPVPALNIRPRKLSVTQIEKLIRNPYAIYASSILNLKKLTPLEKEPDNADFGSFIHKVLDSYNKQYDKISDNHEEFLLNIAKKILEDYREFEIYDFWRQRFLNISKWFLEYDSKERKNHQIYSEISGKISFETANGPFTLTAKADRIAIDKYDNISIIDYKTGYLPSLHDSNNFLSPQLSLEGLIATRNGFKSLDIGVNYSITSLTYILLKASENSSEIRHIKNSEDAGEEMQQFITLTSHNLQELILKYDNPATSYQAYPDKKIAPSYDDYEHLSRVKEWSR